MKIAVASNGEYITNHFGHCENFNVFSVENKKIVQSESIFNPGHKPGYLPNFLGDFGINVIISGGMGSGALEICNQRGIEVIIGASGNAEEAVKAYLSGELKSSGTGCQEHRNHEQHSGCNGNCGH